MELRLHGIAFLAIALIFIVVCVLSANGFEFGDDACSNISPSSCKCYNGDELKVECPRESPEIELRVEANRVLIQCYHNSNSSVYARLSDIKLPVALRDPIDNVHFMNCPLPEGTTIKGILVDRLGINRVLVLVFFSQSEMQIRREQLTGLTSLLFLWFYGPISDLPEDAFNDVSTVPSLKLRSSNVHLPKNLFKNLHELESLDLKSNNLSQLPEGIFSNQFKLRRLDLSGNNLRNLTRDLFLGAASVTNLDLSSNDIEIMQPDVFAHLEDLEIIKLSDNRFVGLPIGLFRKNKRLRVVMCHLFLPGKK